MGSSSSSKNASNFRKGRRNDKYLATWAQSHRPYKKRKKTKRPINKVAQNSPITFIKLPPTPYNYVPGQGYVSRPASAGSGLMNILSSVMMSSAPKEQVRTATTVREKIDN